MLDSHGDKFLTRRESPTEPPNYFIRTASGQSTAVTHFTDPQPLMRKVQKQLVTYKRNDGVQLSLLSICLRTIKRGLSCPPSSGLTRMNITMRIPPAR